MRLLRAVNRDRASDSITEEASLAETRACASYAKHPPDPIPPSAGGETSRGRNGGTTNSIRKCAMDMASLRLSGGLLGLCEAPGHRQDAQGGPQGSRGIAAIGCGFCERSEHGRVRAWVRLAFRAKLLAFFRQPRLRARQDC